MDKEEKRRCEKREIETFDQIDAYREREKNIQESFRRRAEYKSRNLSRGFGFLALFFYAMVGIILFDAITTNNWTLIYNMRGVISLMIGFLILIHLWDRKDDV